MHLATESFGFGINLYGVFDPFSIPINVIFGPPPSLS